MLVKATRNFRDQKNKKLYHYKGDEFEVDPLFARGLVKFGFVEVVKEQPKKAKKAEIKETPKQKEVKQTPKKRGRKPKNVHNTD